MNKFEASITFMKYINKFRVRIRHVQLNPLKIGSSQSQQGGNSQFNPTVTTNPKPPYISNEFEF